METRLLIIFLLGSLLILFLLSKAFMHRIKLSPVIGYLTIGWISSQVLGLFSVPHQVDSLFEILSEIGVILFLFQVGLEVNLKRLMSCLGKAGVIGICNMSLSGMLAFGLARFFGLESFPSLLIGLALSATSIGVSVALFKPKELKTRTGTIFLDIVALDDIIAIALLTFLLLFASTESMHIGLLKEIGFFGLKCLIFGGFCYAFSRFVEPKIMRDLIKYEKMPDAMISVIGMGLVIASLAMWLGFSFAIGAFFAGIAFGRDPKGVKIGCAMNTLFDFFIPFFFFWIGYQTSLDALSGMWLFFTLLLIVAIVGKFIGTYVPSRLFKLERKGAFRISLGAIPRAEISLVIMGFGKELHLITEGVFSAVALVAASTCLLTPLFLKAYAQNSERVEGKM